MRQFFSLIAIGLLSISGLSAAESLRLDVNENLFYVLATINAAGYDEGLNLPANSPVRKTVRDYLAAQNISAMPDLKRYYLRHMLKDGVQDLSQYISYALSTKGPPDFGWKFRDVEIPPDALALSSFTPLLIDTYTQGKLGELWRRVQPEYERELARYHDPLLAMTNQINSYLRASSGGFLNRRFQVFVDLLGAPGQVQTRNYGDDAFVILTPTEQLRMFDLRHAYLHFQVDPIMIKYGVDLQQKRSLLDLVQTTPLDTQYKDDFVLLANESLIKAIEGRLDKDSKAVERALGQGYIMAPFFNEQLQQFEKQEQGMLYFAADMVIGIDVSAEAKRLSTVKFDRAQLQRTAKQVVVAGPELSPAGKRLETAESLYSARNLDAAKQEFEKSLLEKGAPAEQAQGWYGLARIDMLRKLPESAVKFLEKTLASSPDPFTQAWADVYMGRLMLAGGDQDAGRKYLEAALAVKDASEKAIEAARNDLQELSKDQEKK